VADLLGAIGDFAEPIGGALDFVAPAARPTGAGFSLGGLLKSVAGGAADVVRQGPGAIAGAGQAALDLNSGLSARDRLLMGGVAALGGGMLARQAHLAWKQSLTPDMVKPAPVGYANLLELGEPRRFDPTPIGNLAKLQNPGIHPRQAEILSAVDYDGVIGGIRRWDPADAAAETHGRHLFERYALSVGSAEDAQIDWARFDHAVDRGVFSGEANAKIRKLWKTLVSSPQSLSVEESEELFGIVRAVNDATQAAGHDFSTGVVGRIERIEMTDNGPILYTRRPVGWDDGAVVDPVVRTERLRQLNYRQLAQRGRFMLRTLYERGMADWERPEGAPRRLPEELEVGPEWYPTARRQVAEAFGLEDVDSDELERAVASVSFLSEAEDWSTNIEKAKRVMQSSAVHDGVMDGDFQAWLRSNKAAPYLGGREKAHQKTFNQIHDMFKSSGFKVSGSDLGVVLRLIGRAESTSEIFATTARRKQKNFYLNIYHPGLEYPVTIDRHAFDAFLGMDSGIQDRPIDVSLLDGDQVYDVIADTYRSLAQEMGVLPHQLQAVVWETWRMLKRADGRNGWARNDPFMLPEEDGSVNVVYEALNGRDITGQPGAIGGRTSLVMPKDVLKVDSTGIASAALPDGSVAHIAEITDEVSSKLRNYYPAVLGADRVPRWAPIRPQQVQAIDQVRASLAPTTGAHGEAILNAELDRFGVHPLLDAGDSITFELDLRQALPKVRGLQVQEMGRVEIDEPELSLERLAPEKIDPGSFVDPMTSPLRTHQFVAISAVTPDGDRTHELFAELNRRGYNPIEQQGRYTMDDGSVSEEISFLVFGMPTDEGLELGAKYGQESVLVPQGLVYSDGSGMFRPSTGLDFGMPASGSDRSLVGIGGQEITFSFDFDWDNPPVPFTPDALRSSSVRRKAVIKMPVRGTSGLAETADELLTKGAKNVSIYARTPSLKYGDGTPAPFQRVSEHLYSDGVQTYAMRTTAPSVTASNAGYVFVQNADGLPAELPTITPSKSFDEVAATLPNVNVTRRGDKVTIETTNDVSAGYEAKAALEPFGGEFELRSGSDRFSFPTEPKRAKTATVLLKNGTLAPAPRRDTPMPDWERDFGFEFDPGYRVGNQVHRLSDRTVAALRATTEAFYRDYEDAFRRFRMPRITVSPGQQKSYAQLEWSPGGMIILSKEWWSDQDRMMRQLWDDRDRGILAKGADVSPESILAHEYGHVIHGAIVLAEGWKKSPEIDKRLRQMAKSKGRGSWNAIAQDRISETAGKEPSELVAESFSELYTGKPSALASAVVDMVTDELKGALKYRKVVGL
jgi:hypothetical protein